MRESTMYYTDSVYETVRNLGCGNVPCIGAHGCVRECTMDASKMATYSLYNALVLSRALWGI